MRIRGPLPSRLGGRFTIQEAARAGVGRSRRDAPDLLRPFPGIRSVTPVDTFSERVSTYHRRMKPAHRYVGRTAMRLWGLPLPWEWNRRESLQVAFPPDAAPPRTAGVMGRRLAPHRAETLILQGVPVVDAIAAFFSTAAELDLGHAIAVADALLTTADDYPGLGPGRPLATRESIARRLAEWGRFPGSATVREALKHAREKVESPKETETRLLLVNAGMHEPEIQFEVRVGRRLIARTDLAYPELKIAIEYEGDGHRRSKEQWRVDIRRQRELATRGWIVVRLTQADLDDGGRTLLQSVRSAFETRRSS